MKRILIVFVMAILVANFAFSISIVGGDRYDQRSRAVHPVVDLVQSGINVPISIGYIIGRENRGDSVLFLHYIGEATDRIGTPDQDKGWFGITEEQTLRVFGVTLDEIDRRTLADPNGVYTFETEYNGVPIMILSVTEYEKFETLTPHDSEINQAIEFFNSSDILFGVHVGWLYREIGIAQLNMAHNPSYTETAIQAQAHEDTMVAELHRQGLEVDEDRLEQQRIEQGWVVTDEMFVNELMSMMTNDLINAQRNIASFDDNVRSRSEELLSDITAEFKRHGLEFGQEVIDAWAENLVLLGESGQDMSNAMLAHDANMDGFDEKVIDESSGLINN